MADWLYVAWRIALHPLSFTRTYVRLRREDRAHLIAVLNRSFDRSFRDEDWCETCKDWHSPGRHDPALTCTCATRLVWRCPVHGVDAAAPVPHEGAP